MKRPTAYRYQRAVSLIEILVVIVIFLVGILAVVQIFPRGLGILKNSRNISVGTQLARAELERLKGHTLQIPDAIVANTNGAADFSDVDVTAQPNDFVPTGTTGVSVNGILNSPYGTGKWQLYTGANRFRGILGEGTVVPAPRFVPGAANLYAGVMTLQFGPLLAVPGDPVVRVYGSDLNRFWVEEQPAWNVRDYTVYIDDTANVIYLPSGTNRERRYRISLSYYVDTGARVEARSIILSQTVPASNPRVAYAVDLSGIALAGETLVSVDRDSIRVQREFLNVGSSAFSTAAAVGRDDAAYEYKLVDPVLGILAFNPAGYDYQEFRRRARVPLVARVDYSVLDWRILRDDFRVPSAAPFQQRLMISGLKAKSRTEPDLSTYQGMDFAVNVGSATPQKLDFVLVDTDTGGVFTPDSYRVNFSTGFVQFIDVDGNNGNGITSRLVYPGDTAVTQVNEMNGRPVRALYQAIGEWAVQPFKGSSEYRPTWGAGISYDQCYPGLADNANGNPAFVYFPLSDVGKKVIIGEIWYRLTTDAASAPPRVVYDQEFVIKKPIQGDLTLGHIDIRDATNADALLDFSNGYAVRRVRGVTVSVRVTWNPNSLRQFTNDPVANLGELNNWLTGLRRIESETFLTQGGAEQQ
ncbi:MAG: prepilin-type N-terminal cleavage/methylation domain-containing protein [Armatimonadetes bacterium]|nr:prepilin-type N-terminal cleavage/methylation domain-containing protein [Armatimonadota bacterium]